MTLALLALLPLAYAGASHARGRLVVMHHEVPKASVLMVDSAQWTELTVPANSSYIYTSPGRRFALAPHKGGATVIDGGLYNEPHEDHFHASTGAPSVHNTIVGPDPTHFDKDEVNKRVAIFFDGGNGQMSSVQLHDEETLEKKSAALATLPLSQALHGAAEPRGDFLLTVDRDSTAPTAGPNRIVLYQKAGTSYNKVRDFDSKCPQLHGSAQAGKYTMFGCNGSVVIIEQNGNVFTDYAAPIPNGHRITTIHTTPYMRGIGVAQPSPTQTVFYDIDPAARAVNNIDLPVILRRAHTMDRGNRQLAVLDSTGMLHALNWNSGRWGVGRSFQAIPQASMPTAMPWPSMTNSHSTDEIFLANPATKELHMISSATWAETGRMTLPFTPRTMTWVGIADDRAVPMEPRPMAMPMPMAQPVVGQPTGVTPAGAIAGGGVVGAITPANFAAATPDQIVAQQGTLVNTLDANTPTRARGICRNPVLTPCTATSGVRNFQGRGIVWRRFCDACNLRQQGVVASVSALGCQVFPTIEEQNACCNSVFIDVLCPNALLGGSVCNCVGRVVACPVCPTTPLGVYSATAGRSGGSGSKKGLLGLLGLLALIPLSCCLLLPCLLWLLCLRKRRVKAVPLATYAPPYPMYAPTAVPMATVASYTAPAVVEQCLGTYPVAAPATTAFATASPAYATTF